MISVTKSNKPMGIREAILHEVETRGIEKGRQEGIDEGIEKGRQEGIDEGIEKGRQEGIDAGLQLGEESILRHAVPAMLEKGFSIEEIAEILSVSLDKVQAMIDGEG
jgi:predicted transposase YdaD